MYEFPTSGGIEELALDDAKRRNGFVYEIRQSDGADIPWQVNTIPDDQLWLSRFVPGECNYAK